MKAVKAYFLSRLSREKILVTTLIFAGAAVWLVIFAGKARVFWKDYSRQRTTLNKQAATIARSSAVDERSEKAVAILVPAQTLTAGSLNAAVNQMARDAGIMTGLTVTAEQDTTAAGGQFSIHKVRMQAVGIDNWNMITNFYLRLSQRQPYMNLDTFQILAQGTPARHNLNVTISAVDRQKQ